MLDRLRDIGVGTGRLLRAEGDALVTLGRRSAFWSAVGGLGGVVLVAGAAGLLTALTAGLSLLVHWIIALAIVSAGLSAAGLAVITMAKNRLRDQTSRESLPIETRMLAEAARTQISGNTPQADSAATTAGQSSDAETLKDRAAAFVAQHPAAVGGGAALALAAFGPWKTLKLFSRGMLLASVANKVHDQMSISGQMPSQRQQPPAPRHHRSATAAR